MAKQAFIALLLIIAIWIAPTHATAPNVKAEAATGRKLVENFQDQKVEGLIKLPHKVMVPSEGTCYPPNYDQCDPGCLCFIDITPTFPPRPPMPGNCVCPMPPTYEAAMKMVGKFQDDQTVTEKLIKLPHKVMVRSEGTCDPPNYDQCDPGCFCIITPTWPWIRPPMPGNCVCPIAVPPTLETVRKMVGKFQDQTVVEKLIKLPQRVGVPNGGKCLPGVLECDAGCGCMANIPRPQPPPVYGTCVGSCA